jgi:ParB family chromosome partitioning protein
MFNRKEMEMSAVSIDAMRTAMSDARTNAEPAVKTNAIGKLQVPPWEDVGDACDEALAEDVRGEGWNWVVCERGSLALDLRRYGTEAMAQREPTAEEVRMLATLELACGRLKAAHAANEAERDPQSDVYCSQEQFLSSALDDARDRLELAEDSLREWASAQMARLGAVVCVDATGAVIVHRGIFRRGERLAGDGPHRGRAIDPQLMRDLAAHRTAALQAMVMQSPEAALAILVHRMVETLFDRHGRGNDVVKVHLQPTTDDTLSSEASDYENSPAGWLLTSAHTEWCECLPATSDTLLHWLFEQDQDTLLSLLAYCTARSINAISSAERSADDSDALAQVLHLDMADWWMPTVDNYLRRVTRREAVAAVREATGIDRSAEVAGMKRHEAARYCASKLEGTRWLPEVLRRQAGCADGFEQDERGI